LETLARRSHNKSTVLSFPYFPKISERWSLFTLRVNLSTNKVLGSGVGLLFFLGGELLFDLLPRGERDLDLFGLLDFE